MASGKEIRTQIGSIQNTQKITSAMEMVAASKMRKAKERMLQAQPYASKMRTVVAHLSRAHSEYKHPFMIEREMKRAGFIVITSDRGLCGGLNANLFRNLLGKMKELDASDVGMEFCAVGTKGVTFLNSIGAKTVSHKKHLGDNPTIDDLIGSVKVMLDAYAEGRIDRLYLMSNVFVNSMTQKPTLQQLLPLKPDESEKEEIGYHWDYIYEPEAKDVLEHLLMRYIESQVYQSVVENVACEMSARMIAMKAATDNAGDLINELQLVYNKARQAAITQEISEIVSGAAAV